MNVLLQQNIWEEYAYDRFIASIVRQHHCIKVVNVIPFTTDFDVPVQMTPDVIFGSGRFVNVCREKGFPTFKSFAPIEEFYPKEYWLNGAGYDIKWGDVNSIDLSEPVFIKPYTEKFFTGAVISEAADFNKLQLATSFIDDEAEELVRVSDVFNIETEIRFYVIGGKVISGSAYKVSGIPKQYQVTYGHDAWQVCQKMIDQYGSIDDAFVIDFGLVEGSTWKIIELNNINSSGLYKIDTDAFVRALNIYIIK